MAKEPLAEVQDRRQQQEDEEWKEIEDNIASWDTERRRTCTISAKMWQLAQSSATKAENLENDFTEAAAKSQEFGWTEGKNSSRCWLNQDDGRDW